MFYVWWVLASWLIINCLLAITSHDQSNKGAFTVLLHKGTNPIHKGSAFKTSQRLHLKISPHRTLDFNKLIWGWRHTFLIHNIFTLPPQFMSISHAKYTQSIPTLPKFFTYPGVLSICRPVKLGNKSSACKILWWDNIRRHYPFKKRRCKELSYHQATCLQCSGQICWDFRVWTQSFMSWAELWARDFPSPTLWTLRGCLGPTLCPYGGWNQLQKGDELAEVTQLVSSKKNTQTQEKLTWKPSLV